jgi:AcrR family transcriptional regulator
VPYSGVVTRTRKPTRTAKKRTKAGKQPVRAPRSPPLPATGRHLEILNAAMELIAEHGYAGASLRELARRVGMSQPSLYHYFATKQDLVLQILETHAANMMVLPPAPADFAELPRICADAVTALYAGRDHPLFARVMFATSRLDPSFGARCREIFVDRVQLGMRMLVAPYVARGEIAEPDAIDVLRLVIYAIGFRYMEERVLFDDRPLGPDFDRYIDFVVATAEQRIRQLRAA